LISGRVENTDRSLLVGEFVTVTVELPAPKGEIEVPTDAVIEDGRESIVFVQPNPKELRFVRTRVSVTRRFHDVVYLKADTSPAAVHPGDLVVTSGSLLMRDGLEELPLPAAHK
jgi:cobalt-zinc-cadmium efflux system membrane fusion protein